MVQIIKKVISAPAYYFGLWRLLFFISGLIKQKKILAIFTFHRIIDPDLTGNFYLNYDKGLDRDTYEMHIKAIRKYFKVVTQDEFLDILFGKKIITEHSALITFDDADANFITQALPVLEQYNCPSVTFAPTDYIDSDKRFWHLKVSNIFKKLNESRWSEVQNLCDKFPDTVSKVIQSSSVADETEKAAACRRIVNTLDKLEQSVIDSVVITLEEITGSDYVLGIRCMNWNELNEVQRRNVIVESHSVKHHKLAEQDRNTIRQELADSKDILASKLNCTIKTICYPAGSFSDEVLELAQETGYMAGYTTLPGRCSYPCQKTDKNVLRLPRYTIYGNDKYSTDLFMGKIAIESLKSD